MSSEFVITNARIVTADTVVTGALRIVDGRIADVDGTPSHLNGALDAEGDYVVPGLVELHTDNLEREISPRPGVRWPTRAAVQAHDAQIAAAGITTVFDSLALGVYSDDTLRLEILEDSFAAIQSAQDDGLLRAEHLLHLRCEIAHPGVADLLEPLIGNPLLKLVSLMDHTPGQRQWNDLEKYRQFNRGRSGMSDEEVDRLIKKRQDEQLQAVGPNRRKILEMVRELDLPLASHDDTLPEHVDEAVADGIVISEFPTTLAAAERARECGMGIVMGGPNVVRGGSHSGNISAAELAEAGLLDALSSDYVPVSLMHAAFILHEKLGQPLPQTIATITRNPAHMAGLHDRGELAADKRADLVRVRNVDGVPVVATVWREGRRVA
jgi:alpha-D-ribose 1-methylphosphonate 5-triphosphate diphosphatase